MSEHSPLGASGAERWMECPGSYALLDALKLPTSDEADYAANGTAAHDALAFCTEHQRDAWELLGTKSLNGVEIDAEITNAIQPELDLRRELLLDASSSAVQLIEYKIAAPEVHKHFMGTVDWALIDGDTMELSDYKHGQGIVVEVEHNPQIMYYAFGLLLSPLAEHVKLCRLRIHQPRIAWQSEPQLWEASAAEILEWGNTVLVPAMLRAEIDKDLLPGHWCRFCPAKLVCPVLTGLFRAAAVANPQDIVNWSPEALALSYKHIEGVKHYTRALEAMAFTILRRGVLVPDLKLVHKKANRVWREGADIELSVRLGETAFSKPSLMGPAKVEKLGTEAKALVKEWAFTPTSDLTVALASDPRVGVTVDPLAKSFADALANIGGEDVDTK
jgi:hypothetical protein